jgi:hypothetical protein
MKLQYKRTHVPTGKTDIRDFNDTQLMPHFGVKGAERLFMGEAEKVISMWNKMGVNEEGDLCWSYELVICDQ